MSTNQNIYKDTQQVTLPWMEAYTVTKSVVIDSRQRDCTRFKSSSFYTIELDNDFKMVSSIELKGINIPKTSYNIHSSNNKIDFAIGDFISGFRIINGGTGYTSAPSVIITSPPGIGVTATATAIINAFGTITNIILGVAGSGYIPSKPPFLIISQPNNIKQGTSPRILSIVGNHYTASLRVGEYEIGGNPIPPAVLPSNLLLEIQNSMNYAVNGGVYNSGSTTPFAVRLVSQYPTLNATVGSPEATDTNACLFNRIQILNTIYPVWELLWCSGPNKITNAACVLGYSTVDTGIGTIVSAVITGAGTLIPAGSAIRGSFDYNLKNAPDYVIMSLNINNVRMDRMESPDDGLDGTFAILLLDNNNPETLHDLSFLAPGSITNIGGIQYLQGQTGKGTFWRDTTSVKPIKGYDFDSKKLSFKPAISKVTSITVSFTKFGYKSGGVPLFYNMDGRDHTLLFELSSTDQKAQMKD
jgi:hypothetical protein